MGVRPSVTAALVVAFAAAASVALGGAPPPGTTYRDAVGERAAQGGPDIAAISISHTATAVTFRVRFAKAPPLRFSRAGNWVDVLMVGIDVPPLGPGPSATGWRGIDYVVGTHGVEPRTAIFRPMQGPSYRSVPVVVTGTTLSFSIARARLGNPRWFTFNVAAGREQEATSGGEDIAPATGTFRYRLSG